MAKELDRILTMAIESNPEIQQKVEKAEKAEGGFTKKEIVDSIKERYSRIIYNEIEEELGEKIRQESKEKLEKENKNNQIKEIKSLTISGILIAGLVGLLVNQITELIAYYKPPTEIAGPSVTWILSIVLLAIIVLIMVVWFLGLALKIINEFNSN